MRALIIGGGIAGTTAAIALHKAGWEPVVVEAYDRSAGLDQGAFLTLAANGINALAAIDAADAVSGLGFPTGRIAFTSGTGKALGSMSIAPEVPGGAVTRTLRRADLYAALGALAAQRGIEFVHGRRLVAAQEMGDEVTATFADGTTATADLLIGADGLRSTVRGLIDPAAPVPRFAGLRNVGGFARVDGIEADGGDYRMMWGRRCFFGYTVAPDGEIWWFANPPAAAARGGAAASAEQTKADLIALLADDAGPAARIVAATEGELLVSDDHHLPPVPTWHRGRMLLIGDAAHAVAPSSGQGASQACEDAVVLALTLLERPQDPLAALSAFEAQRRRRVERVVAWGRRSSNSKAPGPVGRVVRDALMPLFMRAAASDRVMDRQRWLFEHHLQWPAPVPR